MPNICSTRSDSTKKRVWRRTGKNCSTIESGRTGQSEGWFASRLCTAPACTTHVAGSHGCFDAIASRRRQARRARIARLVGDVVCDACNADAKAIAAYFMILTTALMTLDVKTMNNVQILMQSEAILADPSNYWISVINVGRHFMLDDVMGPGMEDSEGVGIVIARLMLVADVAGVEPASLALAEDAVIERSMIDRFFKEQLPGHDSADNHADGLPVIRLQSERESEALQTDNDEYFLLDDPKVSVIL